MAPKSPHRKPRRNAGPTSQGSPRPRSSGSTTTGSSCPQSPCSSDFQEQDATGRPSTSSSRSPSPEASSASNPASSSSGLSTPSMEELETSEIKVQDPFTSPLKDADASHSGTDKAPVDDQPEDDGYVQETVFLNHLIVLWSWIQFSIRHWKVVVSVLFTTVAVAICIGICYLDKGNDLDL
ncbi:uncharacterized protein FOBCDRAFT_282828 [Fusarium oxysporum Fo47]|uniref:uncharacterized protein n=1 Tax=Fusarium oxysporum Fo47 TaxID=660027 RepID=UPI002869A728|nr:uncharacterized protein FOBCDRAFT_282828 [Fusarium oxysporum Fo47]QKD63152.2 hypothetical protein FOBCDRAFT_282828 [Fusarium oxysporum Fo47]